MKALGSSEHSVGPQHPRPILVRSIKKGDLDAFLGLVDALADYERLARPDTEARQRLAHDALADPPRFNTLLAERNGLIVGYAVYFETYSTFLARPTLYLEDIFVLENERNRGAGRALVIAVAREALRRGCARIEWQVLNWNTPTIDFYERIGATQLSDWHSYRLSPLKLLGVTGRRETEP